MQGIYLVVLEVIIIIFYGIFVRTSTTDTSLTTYLSTIASGFYFLLAYTAISFRFKMFDWSMLMNMLFILVICLQLNTLYVMFWFSCFQGFSATSALTSTHIIIALQAALAVMITVYEFVGQINRGQLFVIAMVQIFGFALNYAIQLKGVTALTGGGIMTVFLFGYAFSLPIRKLKYSQNPYDEEKEKYFTMTLKFIGLVLIILLWPSFNVMTSIPDLSLANLLSTALLLQQAYLQTFLGLLAAVMTTFASGILLGSCTAVIIDPFASILLGILAPLIYLLYEKYLQKFHMKQYPFDKVLMCLLGAVLSSIFVAGRSGRTPQLATNHSSQAGFQFSSFLLSLVFALIFGAIAGALLKYINALNDQISNKDTANWFIQQECMPLYSDDPLISNLYEKQMQKKLKKEQDAFNLKQSFIASKVRENQLGKVLKQQIQYESRLR